ncbi:MAG: type II secretion system protein GspM [Syntrophotaleaceae bacterium]
MKVPERISRWALWLDQRSMRERILLVSSVLVLGIFFSYVLFFKPQEVKRAGIRTQISDLKVSLTEINSQAEAIKARAKEDPDREYRARQQMLQIEIEDLDGRLRDLTIDLISPRDMADVLRGLLNRQEGLKLVSLENLPAVELLPVSENEAGVQDGDRVSLYRHPVRIVLSGTYLQAVEYLRALEQLPRKLFWDELEIVVTEHPQAEISLRVYTLSQRRGWIGV